MGTLRKLQTEIDKTLKKVAEGLSVFDDIWEQLYATDNANQKEKHEANLKTEIKKLQRYRDQIKTWISSADIKDKTELLEARKDIERRMERFKVCEKEAKTKAFSKEGLGAASRMDPKEKLKNDMRDWLSSVVDTLDTQIEEFDAELEAMSGQKGKKGAKPPPRQQHLDDSIARHRQHITRLEQMLRLLDNDAISAEDVEGVKDLVEDYIDRNQEDFEDFTNPDDLYELLLPQLDNMVDAVVAAPPSHAKNQRDKEAKLEREREERERERQKAAAAAVKAQLAAQGTIRLSPEGHEDEPPAAVKKPTVITVSRSNSNNNGGAAQPPPPPPATQPPPPPPGKPPGTPSAAPSAPLSPREGQGPLSPTARAGSQSVPDSAVSAGGSSMPSTPVRQQGAFGVAAGPQPSPVTPQAAALVDAGPGPRSTPQPLPAQEQPNGFAQLVQPAPTPPPPQQVQQPLNGKPTAASVVAASLAQKGRAVGPAPVVAPPPGSAHTSLDSGEAGRQPVDMSMDSLSVQLQFLGLQDSVSPLTPAASLQLLQSCASRSIPLPSDSLWQSVPQRPRPPSIPIPPSYPSQKLPIFDNPALYEKLDAETLFFIFYNQPGSYQQYLAARELKRQAWRYHKQHGAWFQRHEEPKAGGQPGDDWEQGTYVYFDNLLHDDGTGKCG
ncbi:hypothetical protein N2152v2_004744 [Parachlorella kessleri]